MRHTLKNLNTNQGELLRKRALRAAIIQQRFALNFMIFLGDLSRYVHFGGDSPDTYIFPPDFLDLFSQKRNAAAKRS